GVVRGVAGPYQLPHLVDVEPGTQRVGPPFHDVRIGVIDPARAERACRSLQLIGERPDRADHPLRRHALRRSFDCLLNERAGRATVVVQMPVAPWRTRGAASRSHRLNVPATETCLASGAYRMNRT